MTVISHGPCHQMEMWDSWSRLEVNRPVLKLQTKRIMFSSNISCVSKSYGVIYMCFDNSWELWTHCTQAGGVRHSFRWKCSRLQLLKERPRPHPGPEVRLLKLGRSPVMRVSVSRHLQVTCFVSGPVLRARKILVPWNLRFSGMWQTVNVVKRSRCLGEKIG